MSESPRYDVLIHSGTVVDGAGNPGFRAAVGVQGDQVFILRGDVSGVAAHRRIDASGRYVTPGFIDGHSHSDLVMLSDPTLEMKVRQGVTTEVIGVDGLSYAPFSQQSDLDDFVEQNAGIAGQPEDPLDWRSVADQLNAHDGRCAVNVATFVGNTALRVNAVGWEDDVADRKALDAMRGMLREAMEDGALGLSTGLDYPPGSHASTDELVFLAAEAARLGGIYHSHVRYSLGDTYLDPFREALEIGRRADVPIHITHLSRSARATYTGGAQRMLELLEDATREGLEATFDTYTYEWGGTRLSRLLPTWVQVGGPRALRRRLLDPETRERLRDEITNSAAVRQYVASRPFSDLRLGNLTATQHEMHEGRFLSEVVTERDESLPDVMCDLVLANPGATFTRPSPHAMTLWKFVCHPLGFIASDAVLIGRSPSPRAYGCFSRVLAEFVREERLLTLPEAVRKMTSFPAQRLGLDDRGLLRDGYRADLVVFDLDSVEAPASFERPREHSAGVTDVLVNGVPVLLDGVTTGATPGRGLRGPAATRTASIAVLAENT